MAMLSRLANRLSARLASEGGFAIPTVMLMTVAALGIASVAVMTSIQGQSGVVRDQQTKSALAVAESGVEQALLHYNRNVAPCQPAGEGEWCGPVTGMSVNGGSVEYWARLTDSEGCGVGNEVSCVEIVSQGTVDNVTRRVDVFASTLSSEDSPNKGPFYKASVISKETLTLDSNAVIHTGTETNGNIELKSNARQCGQASVGIGKKLTKEPNTGYYNDAGCTSPGSTVLEQEVTLPAVDQGEAATKNDNGRLFSQDLVSGNKADACWSGFNASGQRTTKCGPERELLVEGNSAVTLGGTVYSFCKLALKNNSAFYIESGANVTIYFDSPEDCGYTSATTQLELQSNSRITSATGKPISIAMLFVGSETIPTRILLNSNTAVNGPCEQNFVIYAPLSEVELNSNSKFCGAIAGKVVHLDSNAEIWTASGSEEFSLPEYEAPPTPPHYTPFRFVECSATSGTSPDSGC
jgi:type II secretory pathway pseudopilin PulG